MLFACLVNMSPHLLLSQLWRKHHVVDEPVARMKFFLKGRRGNEGEVALLSREEA